MAALSLPFTMRDIGNALGLGTGIITAADIAAASTNDCSPVDPDQTTPWNVDSWDGYDHTSGPPAPGTFTGNPGSSASPAGDLTQDSHVFMKIGGPILCANSYDVGRASSSGGAISVISNDQGGESYTYNHATPNSIAGYFYMRGNSNLGNAGTWSGELVLRTAPNAPLSITSSDDAHCLDMTITVSWSLGTAPGLRNSVAKWRQRFKASGGSYGGWSGWGSTATGAASLPYNVGAVNNGDVVQFEVYYDEESSSTAVTETWTALCPE